MRVCIVNPPSPFLLDERVFMPLGALKIATVLRARGIDAFVLDLSGVADYRAVFNQMLWIERPTHVGFSVNTPQLPAVFTLTKSVRGRARILIGGPHVTVSQAAAKRERSRGLHGRACRALEDLQRIADVLIAGDGEAAVVPALDAPDGTLFDADDPKGPWYVQEADLPSYPAPDRSLIDVDSYHFTIDGVRALSVIAQLGCPFGCGFCGGRLSATYRRVRNRAPGHVVDELLAMHDRYGVTGFMFVDDEINVSRAMPDLMQVLADAAKSRDVSWTLRAHVKAELFTDAQAELMVLAGFRSIFVGFESGHDRILTNINKHATQAENTRCMAIARRHGLAVKALMSVGHPGESIDTIAETRRWLLDVKPDDLGVSVITTYPGTPYYDDAVQTERGWCYTAKSGDRLYASDVDYLSEAVYYKGLRGSYKSFVHTDFLSAEQLVAERDHLESDVRDALGLPWPTAVQQKYEQSMGQAVIGGVA